MIFRYGLRCVENKYKNIVSTCILRCNHFSGISYVQGQEPEPKIREYFYYIDHEGMVRFLQLKILLEIYKFLNVISFF